MKTNKTYENAIKGKYYKDEESGQLRSNLYDITRSKIRDICLNIIDEGLSNEDERVMKNYFKLENNGNLRRKVENYNIEGFRPIYNFLRGDTESIQLPNALELIAIMVNFKPRPYTKYRNQDSFEELENKENENVKISIDHEEKSMLIINQENKNLFTWFSNASTSNKLKSIVYIIVVFASIIATTNYILRDQSRWMVWQEDHYVEVEFDVQKYDINRLKVFKEERILNFKEITPNCNTKFFKEDGIENLWYGKNENGELEYFTDLGLHPETGRTLKKITQHMIKKYICDTY